jgi:SAM-dependent methyltransferase
MLLRLGECHGLCGRTALDVACGTGKGVLPLVDRGWNVTACDIAPAMIEVARGRVGDRVQLNVADMRELPVYGRFDLVCCLDDAVNYLLSAEELEQTLASLEGNLAADGVLIFDSNTLATYRGFFGEHVEVEANGRRLIWDGRTGGVAEPGQISEAAFQVEPVVPGSGGTIPPELHRQRHHPQSEVRSAVAAVGLEVAGVYGHHHDAVPEQPASEESHTKTIYLCRRDRRRRRN